ncbi:hypothetical protein [Alicyclobacillus ferrooxydans]|uniref:Uncharacterized protein n=1 Tax=Alicyclobacillus ferrooxydans TaxID=471514 RepID=A0A0P9CW45_9BACL|nr:hypothetical protein [Alicyclobacillus ferrooxydans]KPV40880.1 hypothetical protein AN477_21595 [Alicyclobacillus ferrooxydans]
MTVSLMRSTSPLMIYGFKSAFPAMAVDTYVSPLVTPFDSDFGVFIVFSYPNTIVRIIAAKKATNIEWFPQSHVLDVESPIGAGRLRKNST